MIPNDRRRWSCLAVALVLGGLAGCVPLINPRVHEPNYRSPEQPAAGYSTAQDWCPQGQDYDPGICTSLAYAYNYQLRFAKAAAADASFRSATGALAIPVGAAALYYGVTRVGTPQRVAGMSVTGAALYSSATWLTSTTKQKVYLAGSQATLCAMYAASPFLLTQVERTRFNAEIDALAGSDQQLATAIDTIAAQDDGSTDFTRLLARARSVHQDASNLLGEAYEIDAAIARAGFVLRNRVDMIAAKVQDQLVDQAPSLESLLSLIGNMDKTANSFAHATLQAPAAPAAQPTNPNAIVAHGKLMASPGMDDLRRKIDATESALLVLRPEVTRHAALRTVASDIDACQPAGAQNGFAVNPDVRTATVVKDKTLRFAVTNKVAVPTITVTGTNTDAIEAHTEVEGGNFAVVVKGVKAVSDGTPILVIRDGTGAEFRETAITVTDSAPAPVTKTAAPAPASPTYACDNASIAADASQIKTIQGGLRMCSVLADPTQAGVLGPQTRSAIRQYEKAAGQPETGCVTSVLLMAMTTAYASNPCPPAP